MGQQHSKDEALYQQAVQQHSKDEALYQQVVKGNVENIKALFREGAGLEWMDKGGRTALIVASMGLYLVAKTLIEMGANVNAYRPGPHAGSPLHHAAKIGLDDTVKLLLSHGANPFVRNDDCQTALDVARTKGYNNVVRAIEGHTCYYSGHVRELFAPGFIEKLASQLLSRKCWAVVVPCSPPNPSGPPKVELAIYPSEQDAQPHAVIPLWRSEIEDPKFHQSDPVLIIYDHSSWTRHKFASVIVGDKKQIRRLYNACKGISQVMPFPIPNNDPSAPAMLTSTSVAPDFQSTNAPSSSSVNDNGWGDASVGASHNGWSTSNDPPSSKASSSGWMPELASEEHNGWAALSEPNTLSPEPQHSGSQGTEPASAPHATNEALSRVSSAPSAPPVPYVGDPIHYPTIDASPVDISGPMTQNEAPKTGEARDNNNETSCVICWEAPVEGACVPCGHMAGCMSCLNEIKAKKGDCPVCRAKIKEVIRLYAV